MMRAWFSVLACCCVTFCGAAAGGVQIDCDGPSAPLLSAYGLFSDLARQVPSEGVLPYELTSLLFTDYAVKHRFVWMPQGTAAAYRARDVLDFPVGTVLVKTLGFLHDMRAPEKGERLVETRLLLHARSGWVLLPYLWNEDGTDARLALAGARVPVEWTHSDGSRRAQRHIVPNVNQCKQCHLSHGEPVPIGPKARYLNRDLDYGHGAENQLAHWSRIGFLDAAPAPEAAPRAPAWDAADVPLDDRARSYLDMNCAFCHSPGGTAYTSGLDLSFDQPAPFRIGIFKSPVAAGRSASVGRYDIVPGRPAESILLYRMASTDPGVRMPVLGRGLVHEEGLELIRAWIAAMPPEDEPTGVVY